jgi:hypothetical protein
VFRQAGFIYSTPESINYNPKGDYFIEALKEALQEVSTPRMGRVVYSTERYF